MLAAQAPRLPEAIIMYDLYPPAATVLVALHYIRPPMRVRCASTGATASMHLAEGRASAVLLLRLSLRSELIKGARYARVFPLPVSAARPTERPFEMAVEASS